MGIFEGLVGFVIEEAIVGGVIIATHVIVSNAINSALSLGFTSTAALIYLVWIVLILIPVVHHLLNMRV